MVVFPEPEGAEKTNNFPLKFSFIYDDFCFFSCNVFKTLQEVLKKTQDFFIKYLKFVL